MKPMIVGMCAHVDAGKTTLSEALLYQSGKIKSLGRVDHGTTVLDFEPLERQRGITITAKEAFFTWRDYFIGYPGTSGLFCGIGTYVFRFGCSRIGHQRYRSATSL